MRARLIWLTAGLLLTVGCSKTAEVKEAPPEDEKAAEQRIKDEAARELKDRRQEEKERKNNPADRD